MLVYMFIFLCLPQGSRWLLARTTVSSSSSSYSVIFEAIVGDSLDQARSIGVDDVKVSTGACPPEGFCDFELDTCEWYNSIGEGNIDSR